MDKAEVLSRRADELHERFEPAVLADADELRAARERPARPAARTPGKLAGMPGSGAVDYWSTWTRQRFPTASPTF